MPVTNITGVILIAIYFFLNLIFGDYDVIIRYNKLKQKKIKHFS